MKATPVLIDLDELYVDKENHRVLLEPEIAAMIETIRRDGLLQPIMVTDPPPGKDAKGKKHWLVFGHLRTEAVARLRAAGEKVDLPAIYVPGLSASGVADRRAIENLARQKLSPMDEARAISASLARAEEPDIRSALGLPPEAPIIDRHRIQYVAAMLGRDERWVSDRAFLARLSPKCQEAANDGRLPLPFARALASLSDHDDQDRLLPSAASEPNGARFRSLKQIEAEVANLTHKLTSVAWLHEEEFPRQPACLGCPHNSSSTPGLFDGEGDAPPPTCLRPSCFNAKAAEAERAIVKAVDKVRAAIEKEPGSVPFTPTALEPFCPRIIRLPVLVRRVKSWIVAPSDPAPTEKATNHEAKKVEAENQIPYDQQPDYVGKAAAQKAYEAHVHRVDKLAEAAIGSSPHRRLALYLLGQTKAIRSVVTDYMGEASQAKALPKRPWREAMKAIRHIVEAEPLRASSSKSLLGIIEALFAEAFPKGRWRDLIANGYHLSQAVFAELAGAVLGEALPAAPALDEIYNEAFTAQVEKLKAPAKEPKAEKEKKPRAKRAAGKAAKKSGRKAVKKK